MTYHKLNVAIAGLALAGFNMKYLVLYARIVDDKEINLNDIIEREGA